MKCHNKGTNDFVFVGSSSLFATAGQSSDNFNVCLWDTLLPKNKALVKGSKIILKKVVGCTCYNMKY